MFFGKKLKELRLEYAKEGLRKFPDKIYMCPSEYSKMERGLIPPPKCKKWIFEIITALNLGPENKEALELYDLWSEPFVMQKMNENFVCSPFTHKSDGTPLTAEEFIGFNEHINSIGRNHNKVAEEYNKERNGIQKKSN